MPHSTLIFNGFAFESISSGPPFLKSCVTLVHTKRFLLARVQLFQPLSQSKFIPSEYWDVDHVKDEERPNLNHLGKNLQLLL